MNSANLAGLDKKFLWHPFTQQADWTIEPPLIIDKGKGHYLYDISGKKYLDAVSSLWVNIHGHTQPALDSALKKQLKLIAHSTFLGLTHRPGIELAVQLIKIAPQGLARVFYSDNGACAVEIALKMAYQYHRQKNKKAEGRKEFLALKNSYHGDTIGSVSVGGITLFHRKFKPLLFKSNFATSPYCYRCKYNKRQKSEYRFYQYSPPAQKKAPAPGDFNQEKTCRWECLGDVERILKERHHRIAAAIIEPLVQAAAGIIVMPRGYMAGFAALCRKYNVLLISDEVACGFGRTGYMFASQAENVCPDLMCVAKSITGGYLPLAATLATENIYEAFLGKYEEFKTFFHGHTYTANPLACAVAIENLKQYKGTRLLEDVGRKSRFMVKHLKMIASYPHVGQVRQAGLMIGIELVQDRRTGRPYPASEKIGQKVCRRARTYGLILRPLGDVIVLMPPLTIKYDELEKLIAGVEKAIMDVTGRPI